MLPTRPEFADGSAGGRQRYHGGTLRGWKPVRETVTVDDPEERAKELQARLVVLRLREGTANFENREAIRREIRRVKEELEALGVDPDDDIDADAG